MRSAVAVGVIALVAASGAPAFGHRMLARWQAGAQGEVLLQAFFPDGTPAAGARVEVMRPDGTVFSELQADEQGRVTVRPDLPGRWQARFETATGHAAAVAFEVSAPQTPGAGEEKAPAPAGPESGPAPAPAVAADLIEKVPMPWTEVLAGLAFIFGLAAFLWCWRLQRRLNEINR